MVRFSILKNLIYSIFVEIKQSLILDPDLNQIEHWDINKKSKYMFRFSISKEPQESMFVKTKLKFNFGP